MCKYCETVEIDGREFGETECELMENLPIVDEFTERELVSYGEDPIQYIRRYGHKYSLITEFDNGSSLTLLLPINNCPMCGRVLNAELPKEGAENDEC